MTLEIDRAKSNKNRLSQPPAPQWDLLLRSLPLVTTFPLEPDWIESVEEIGEIESQRVFRKQQAKESGAIVKIS